jgi:hypothetical protein
MKEVFMFIAALSLFGCFVGYDGAGYRDRLILNSYYEMLYIKPSLNLHALKPAYISHLAHNKKYHVEIYDFKNYEVLIDFYQDSDHKCYLFSKSNKDLFALEKRFHQSSKEDQSIFLIEKYDIRVVSRDVYKEIKETLKPHPYDPSLCKPKPAAIDKVDINHHEVEHLTTTK